MRGNLTNITGRDEDIITKAIAYAVGAIDGLPDSQQEVSDREDMITILHVRVSRQITPGSNC
jgi:hypothetical protein